MFFGNLRIVADYSKKVIDNLTAKYANVKKGIGDVMGGKILDYEAKDILNQGIEKGIEKGGRKERQ